MSKGVRECASCGRAASPGDSSCIGCGSASFRTRKPPATVKPVSIPSPSLFSPAPAYTPPRPSPYAAKRRRSLSLGLWEGIQVLFFTGFVCAVLALLAGGIVGGVIGGIISAVVGGIASAASWTTWSDYYQTWFQANWFLTVWTCVVVASLILSRGSLASLGSTFGCSGEVLSAHFRAVWLVPHAAMWIGLLVFFAPPEWARVSRAHSLEASQSNELVQIGKGYLESAGDNFSNASKAVTSLLEAVRIWPENNKAKEELQHASQSLVQLAEQAFREGQLLKAHNLFVQATAASAQPERVRSSEETLYRFTEIPAPQDSWSEPVSLDSRYGVEIHSDSPIEVRGDFGTMTVTRSQDEAIKIQSRSIQLRSVGGRIASVKVFTLKSQNRKNGFRLAIFNPMGKPSTPVQFFIGWMPQAGSETEVRSPLPLTDALGGSVRLDEPTETEVRSPLPLTEVPTQSPTPVNPPLAQRVASARHVISVPDIARYYKKSNVELYLYGEFSFRGWKGSVGFFKTKATIGLPIEGPAKVNIEFAKGIGVSAGIRRLMRNRDLIIPFRVPKNAPIKILRIQRDSNGTFIVDALSQGGLSMTEEGPR